MLNHLFSPIFPHLCSMARNCACFLKLICVTVIMITQAKLNGLVKKTRCCISCYLQHPLHSHSLRSWETMSGIIAELVEGTHGPRLDIGNLGTGMSLVLCTEREMELWTTSVFCPRTTSCIGSPVRKLAPSVKRVMTIP